MTYKTTDLITIISRMEDLLKRIEKSHFAVSFEQLSMAQLAFNLRQECNRSFPSQYFSVDTWDILLELHAAHRMSKKVKISKLGSGPAQVSTGSLRYIDMLMSDGFLYLENDSSNDGEGYASLTQKGLDHLEELFQRSKTNLATQLITLDVVELQNGKGVK